MSILSDKVASTTKIDPTEFDISIEAILAGLGAEKYINIFKKRNIGQRTLAELSDEDLIKLGVDDAGVRTNLLKEVKNLPIYQETNQVSKSNLGPMEIIDILEESSNHLYRIYLSVMANTLALKKTKKITDCLLHKDSYASDISIITLTEINNILNSMDIALHTQLKVMRKDPSTLKKKKLIVGTVGSTVIAILAVLFVRSLKQLK